MMKMCVLTEMMELVDAYSGVVPEGDYLRMCDLMKEVFERVSQTPTHNSAYWVYLRESNRNRDELKNIGRDLRGLKIRSRVTDAVRMEVGSDDRDTCMKYLREHNVHVLRRRRELEERLSVVRAERERLDAIRDEMW